MSPLGARNIRQMKERRPAQLTSVPTQISSNGYGYTTPDPSPHNHNTEARKARFEKSLAKDIIVKEGSPEQEDICIAHRRTIKVVCRSRLGPRLLGEESRDAILHTHESPCSCRNLRSLSMPYCFLAHPLLETTNRNCTLGTSFVGQLPIFKVAR